MSAMSLVLNNAQVKKPVNPVKPGSQTSKERVDRVRESALVQRARFQNVRKEILAAKARGEDFRVEYSDKYPNGYKVFTRKLAEVQTPPKSDEPEKEAQTKEEKPTKWVDNPLWVDSVRLQNAALRALMANLYS